MTWLALLASCLPLTPLDRDEDGVAAADDCNDGDAAIFPGAVETCDGHDQDCDRVVDNDAGDAATWYEDLDGDGVGGAGTMDGCHVPGAGFVALGGDCDDDDALVHPTAVERCNDLDDDCDEGVDVDAVDALWWYSDGDDDGYGAVGVRACVALVDHVGLGGDCDDADPARHPNATESCDTFDDDCDGVVDDDASDAVEWYADADTDGFGDADAVRLACDAPVGHVSDDTDCDDADETRHPGAGELCDGIDHDCDGRLYAGAINAGTWYWDADGDGSGDPGKAFEDCAPGAPWVGEGTDCDDTNASISSTAFEVCDPANVDEDCDGKAEEPGAKGERTFYGDGDGDSRGTLGAERVACDLPSGASIHSDDCNDNDALVSPGAPERCSTVGVDDDCDGQKDEVGATDGKLYYVDADADGVGDAGRPRRSCAIVPGLVATAGDCDDASAYATPGGPERWCDDKLDNNCNGVVDEPGACGGGAFGYAAKFDGAYAGDEMGTGAAAGDLDGDGDATDLVLASASGYGSDDLTGMIPAGGVVQVVFDAPLTGTFGLVSSSRTLGGGSNERIGTVNVADLDDDGFDDLLAGTNSTSKHAWVLFGPLAAGPPSNLAAVGARRIVGEGQDLAGWSVIGDFDGDGDVDLAVKGGDPNRPLWIVEGPISSTSDTALSTAPQINADVNGGSAGDADGDGVDELIFVHRDAYLIDGSDALAASAAGVSVASLARSRFTGSGTDEGIRGSIEDHDGDGNNDVIVGVTGASQAHLFVRYGGVTWPATSPLASAEVQFHVSGCNFTNPGSFGDLDGDGRVEVGWSCATAAAMFGGYPPGSYVNAPVDLMFNSGAFKPNPVDMGDDNRGDLVTGATGNGAAGSMYLYLGADTP